MERDNAQQAAGEEKAMIMWFEWDGDTVIP